MKVERLSPFEVPITQRLCRWDGCALDVVPGFAYCGQHYLYGSKIRRPPQNEIRYSPLTSSRGKLVAIYAIRCGDTVKIGISWDVQKRLAGLQTSSPFALELLGYTDNVNASLERLIHERLKVHRLKGEWFRLTPEVQEIVDLIVAGDGLSLRHYVTAPTAY